MRSRSFRATQFGDGRRRSQLWSRRRVAALRAGYRPTSRPRATRRASRTNARPGLSPLPVPALYPARDGDAGLVLVRGALPDRSLLLGYSAAHAPTAIYRGFAAAQQPTSLEHSELAGRRRNPSGGGPTLGETVRDRSDSPDRLPPGDWSHVAGQCLN